MIITDTTNQLLTMLRGTGVQRAIITDTRILFFPRLTDEAIERLTSKEQLAQGPDTSIYSAYMRHHYPSTRNPHTFTPGDYDLTGSKINLHHAPNPAKRP